MSDGRARNEGIDVLRGLSTILVVIHHVAIRIPLAHTDVAQILPERLLAALCWNGSESVSVFFVISGFLITGNAIERWGSLGTPRLGAFYMRRAGRILPCLVAVVAVLALLDLARVPDFTITRQDQSLSGATFAALTFHLNWYEAYSWYLPGNWDVLWSLSIEEMFYLAFPAVCLMAGRRPGAFIVVLVLLVLSLPVANWMNRGNQLLEEKAYLPGMAAIATGVLAAMAARRWQVSAVARSAMTTSGIAAWLAIMLAEDLVWPYLGEATMLILTVGTALLLVGLHRPVPPTVPRTRWLQAFGRLSYEVYLTHMFVVFPVLRFCRSAGLPDRFGYALYPMVLAASLGLGWVVARTISQPAERTIRRRWPTAARGHAISALNSAIVPAESHSIDPRCDHTAAPRDGVNA